MFCRKEATDRADFLNWIEGGEPAVQAEDSIELYLASFAERSPDQRFGNLVLGCRPLPSEAAAVKHQPFWQSDQRLTLPFAECSFRGRFSNEQT